MHVVERMSYDWPFERSVFNERVRTLRADMALQGFGALVVTEPSDIYRLTGYDKALRISNEVLRDAIDELGIGVVDRAIAAQMTFDAIALGSDYFAQSPHVRFGPSMAEGHLTWQGRKLEPGDAVELEIAAVIRRYTAPVARFAIAGPVRGRYRTAAQVALDGMRRARTAMRPGVRGADVWTEARAAADGTGLTYLPGGYSVGVGYPPEWSESDLITATSKRELRPGMVIHMVSFCQLAAARVGTGDVLLVTDDGCTSLAPFPMGPGPFEVT